MKRLLLVVTTILMMVMPRGANAAKPFLLTVERNSSCSDGNVNGRLLVDGQEVARTLEPGPEGNRLPRGEYGASIRADGALGWRIELKGVSGWENVQIHLGNYPSNSRGCILVGLKVKSDKDPKTGKTACALSQSSGALGAIQRAMQRASDNGISSQELSIRVAVR